MGSSAGKYEREVTAHNIYGNLESARGDSIFSLTERIVFLMLFVFCACALTEFQRQKK
jgi:hypothetical protein